MQIEELYNMQKALDKQIVENYNKKELSLVDKHQEDFLTERLLALMVEVGELANATRCFKYWSTKESESRDRVLSEYADCWHFLLSIGNSLDFTEEEIVTAYLKKHNENYIRQENGY